MKGYSRHEYDKCNPNPCLGSATRTGILAYSMDGGIRDTDGLLHINMWLTEANFAEAIPTGLLTDHLLKKAGIAGFQSV